MSKLSFAIVAAMGLALKLRLIDGQLGGTLLLVFVCVALVSEGAIRLIVAIRNSHWEDQKNRELLQWAETIMPPRLPLGKIYERCDVRKYQKYLPNVA